MPILRRVADLGSSGQVVAIAMLAAVARLPFLTGPLTPDEAGFSLVARQWGAGASLYGDYWVDRPPLLVGLYGVAGSLGSPVGLRLLGCVAAMATTVFVGLTARRVANQRGALWAAVITAIGLTSPLLGGLPVNGELLAAPFVSGSILCWVVVAEGRGRAGMALALASGAAATCAVLVKQNMVDAFVFCGVCAGVQLLRRRDAGWLPLLRDWWTGAIGALVVILSLAVLRGSSVSGIWYAMYQFRVDAVATMGRGDVTARLAALSQLWGLELLTLGPVVLLVLGHLVTRRRDPHLLTGVGTTVGPAVLAVAAYDVVSIMAGGSYWNHYLVELVVPTALAAALVVRMRSRLGHVLGRAIAAASQPGDSVVSAFGNADIVEASGLPSPYPYLWSLPARTLDANFQTMAELLSGPRAPTWIVVRGPQTERALLSSAAGPGLQERYHDVGTVCGRRILLRDGVRRTTPVASASCAQP